MNWTLCNSTDGEGQGSQAGCSLWGCEGVDTSEWLKTKVAQEGILAMCLKKLQRDHKSQLERYFWKSGPPRATYWEESAHVSTPYSGSDLRNGLRWPGSCGAEVKPGWNLPLPDLPQPAGRGSVREVRVFPSSVRQRFRTSPLTGAEGRWVCLCPPPHNSWGNWAHLATLSPASPHSSWMVDYPVWPSLRDGKMRGILARYVV